MKKLLLSVLIFGTALNAMAADTADLTVKGKLTNSACAPSFSNGGVVDYGSVYLGGLSTAADNQLGVKEITLTITCTGPTAVAWTNTDNRASSRADITVANGTTTGVDVSASSSLFGVGMAGDVKLGAASIYVDKPNVKLDGVPKDVIYIQDDWETSHGWAASTTGVSLPGLRNFALADTGTLIPVAGTVYTIPYKVSVAVQDTTTLAITDKAPLDGNATFTVIYL